MFMCLTYTGDLLADGFISVYSKMVNFLYRQFQHNRMKVYVPPGSRQSFEHPDVRSSSSLLHPLLFSSSPNVKKHVMYRL